MQILALLLVASWSGVGSAATLRPFVVLRDGSVRLSDLFDGLRPGQDCAIGSAPKPGSSLVIPATQVQAIATQFGVELDQGIPVRSLRLERPVRTVQRAEILSALRPALLAAGMPDDSDVDLGIVGSLALAADTAPPSVVALDLDPRGGRFSASLQFTATDQPPQTLRVTGRVDQTVPVFSLRHAIMAGSVVSLADTIPGRVRKTTLRGTPVADMGLLAGQVARQSLASGAVLSEEQFVRPTMVVRGRPVILRLTSGTLSLTAAGTAVEAGGAGDRVRVVNSVTRAILVGTVAGSGEVLVDPDTRPVFPSRLVGVPPLPRANAPQAGPQQFERLPNHAQEARLQ